MATVVVLTGTGAAPGSPFTFNAERVECEITEDPPMVETPSSKSLGTFKPVALETGAWSQMITVQIFVDSVADAEEIREAVKTWWEYGQVTLEYDAVDEASDEVVVLWGNSQIEQDVAMGKKILLVLNFVRADAGVLSFA